MKKSNILEQAYKYNKKWSDLYLIEDKIIDIIKSIYHGDITYRNEIYDLLAINIEFKIFPNKYVCMISKRNNDYGLSIFNIEDPFKFDKISLNKTIENNKYYLYNIYKIVFIVLQNS
jgi:hypothetical protein